MRPSKRDTLLEAAERLFYAEGFHATGIDRVVEEAGVARMTLYNHFASKEALIAAVLERRYRRYLEDLRAVIEDRGNGSAVAALASRHGEWLETVSTHGCIVIRAIAEFEQHDATIAELGRRLKRDLLTLIGEALALDGHPADPDLAGRILVVLEGTDALVPILGAEAATAHLRAIVPRIVETTSEVLP